jgi:murein DD-endopeptidase MepM/ murein hydrolase activator NlpD
MALREAVEEVDRFSLQRRRAGGANAMIGFTYPPLVGGVSDGMNAGIGHLGVDLVAPAGTPIQAVDDGSVLFSSYTVETGYTLLIQHRGERVSVYKHCSSLLKQQGDLVAGGEAVGLMGNTGELTTGPHLHFEWWVRGRALDPTPWLGRTSLWDDGGPVN